MKINRRLIDRYLSIVTESRASMMDDPARDLTAYDGPIDAMGEAARADDTHAHERLWPDEPLSLPGAEPEVEFVAMSPAEWAAYTGRT